MRFLRVSYIGVVGLVASLPFFGVALAGETAPLATAQEAAGKSDQLAARAYEVPTRDAEVRRGETVTGRKRPELDPFGARAGTFLIFPKIEVEESYNDNIFADNDNEESDFITRVLPSVVVQSDWSNHALKLEGGADVGLYAENDDENYEDYRFAASGRVDVRRSTNVSAKVGYQALHEDRASPDDVRGLEPTEYDLLSSNLRVFHNFGRFNVTLGGAFDQYDFDDVQTSVGTINNDDRDRDELEGSLRLAYEIQPQYEAFVRGAYNTRDYDSDVDDNNLNRDSDGYDVVAGVEIDFGGLVFGDFFAGYKSQDYDDPALPTTDGPVLGADITWNVTPLTTITGRLSRVIRETTKRQGGQTASGRFLTVGQLSVDHELRRNLLIGGDVSVAHDDFEGIDRTDMVYRVGLDAKYLINRNFFVSGGYTFRTRDAEFSTDDFTENIFMVRLGAQY